MTDTALGDWRDDADDSGAVKPNGRLKLTPVEDVDPLLVQWARFRDQFAEAMRGGYWTLEDLELKIAEKRAFFFPGRDAAMVGEVQVYPGGARVFQIIWVCGPVPELLLILPGVEALARMMGCVSMLVEGRQAWQRLLKDRAYEPWSVTLFKTL
jgi:hypothetical protein